MTMEQPAAGQQTAELRAAATKTAAPQTTEQVGKPDEDTQAIKTEIEQTRSELGNTIEALAAKADVKARARQTAGTAKAWMRDKAANGPQVARQRARHMTEIAPHRAAEAGRAVRRHPVPAVLAACVAVALLIMGLRRRYR